MQAAAFRRQPNLRVFAEHAGAPPHIIGQSVKDAHHSFVALSKPVFFRNISGFPRVLYMKEPERRWFLFTKIQQIISQMMI